MRGSDTPDLRPVRRESVGVVYTIDGAVDAQDLGPVLPHEHLPLHYYAWDSDEFQPASKYIVREWYEGVIADLAATPFRTLVDVSPIGHGRDIAFRRKLIGRAGINVVMCTGFYIDDHQPEWVKRKSAEELADLLVREIEDGIGDTGVRAGIIKLAPDPASEHSRKVCRAAVLASNRTNARITTHSCKASRAHFDMLVELGAEPERLYIGHADFCEFFENEYVCKSGGHLVFTVWDIDYMIPDKLMYKRFAELVNAGYVESVLMSVDFAIMVHHPAQPTFLSWTLYGIENRTHGYLSRKVIPELMGTYGLTEDQVRTITRDNPRRMLDFRT